MSDNNIETLFIIGNGFDLHHNLKCSYDDYKKYLSQNDLQWVVDFFDRNFFVYDLPPEFTRLHQNLDQCKTQSDFAQQLATNYWAKQAWNTWRCLEMILGYINGIEISKQNDALSFATEITNNISNWMKSDIVSKIPTSSCLKLPKQNCSYLNFNYTDLLEKACNIPGTIINYIHNKIGEKLEFGHANYQAISDVQNNQCIAPKVDNPALQALLDKTAADFNNNQTLLKYYKKCLKDVQAILSKNSVYWNTLTSVSRIYVLGHSMSDVDFVYFEEINRKAPSAEWIISYHNNDSKLEITETRAYKLVKERASFKDWNEIDSIFS